MDRDDIDYIVSKMKDEGFDYCFLHYSSFQNIADEKFHQLRKNYINAHKELETYLLDLQKNIEE